MSEVKFETTVENGTIEIPLKFRKKISGNIEVIIKTVNNQESDEPFDILTELMEKPINDPNFAPFKRNAEILYSEDMQNGLLIDKKLKIINPLL